MDVIEIVEGRTIMGLIYATGDPACIQLEFYTNQAVERRLWFYSVIYNNPVVVPPLI